MSRVSRRDMGPSKPDARSATEGMIEETPSRDLDDLPEIWAKVTPASECEGLELAGDELRAMRSRRSEDAAIEESPP